MAANTSAIISVMVVICMVAVAAPAVIIASQDDGGNDGIKISIDPNYESKVSSPNWSKVATTLNDNSSLVKNYGISFSAGSNCLYCKFPSDCKVMVKAFAETLADELDKCSMGFTVNYIQFLSQPESLLAKDVSGWYIIPNIK